MSEKHKLIAKMIALQKKFIQRMHDDDAPNADADDELRGYTDEGEAMAKRVVELAHEEKQTAR